MTTRAKGTGLGLAIVQRITEQHGGTLQLADAPKRNGKVQGALVRMDLPIREMDEIHAAETSAGNGGQQPAKAPEAAGVEEGATHGV